METFEREFEKVLTILKPILEDGKYKVTEEHLRNICKGFFFHGKSDGYEYAIEKLNDFTRDK